MANGPLQDGEVEEIVGDLIEAFDATISDLHLFLPTITEKDQFPPKLEAILSSLNRSVESFYQDCLYEDKLIEEAKNDVVAFWEILGELWSLERQATEEIPWYLSKAIRRLETINVWFGP